MRGRPHVDVVLVTNLQPLREPRVVLGVSLVEGDLPELVVMNAFLPPPDFWQEVSVVPSEIADQTVLHGVQEQCEEHMWVTSKCNRLGIHSSAPRGPELVAM